MASFRNTLFESGMPYHKLSFTTSGSIPTWSELQKMQQKKVLLLTNSEFGQANVFLATSQALVDASEDVEVHFASFGLMEEPVAKLQSSRIVFHPIEEIDMEAAWMRPEVGKDRPKGSGRRTFLNAPAMLRFLLRVMLPWSGPEFVAIYQRVTQIINHVNPDIVAVDPMFSPGMTACHQLGVNFVVLSPNTIKDFSLPLQPYAEAIWRYPCVGSGLCFPIPWHLVPFNIYLVLVAIIVGLLDQNRKSVQRYLRENTDAKRMISIGDLALNPRLVRKSLVANFPELEYPLRVIPKNIVACGPMTRPPRPVHEVDAELAGWLSRGHTIYVNLGTHVQMHEEGAVQMAMAFRVILDHARSSAGAAAKMEDLQILWKMVPNTHFGGDWSVYDPKSRVHQILGKYLDLDVVRVVDWIKPDPLAVLKSSVLAVHHGGANSFLEAASAGAPQVVLPVWIDTYDFANRAEIVGIGLWGNKKARPFCAAAEFAPVLVEALFGERALPMKIKAREIAKLCEERGNGAVVAANAILNEIHPD